MLGNAGNALFLCGKTEIWMKYKVEEGDNISRCLQCGSIIDYGGRPDRKFCSAGCKNRYHNYRRFRRRDLAQRSVVGKLAKNYEILDRIIHLGLDGMDRVTLAYMGFDPAYATSYCRMGRKNIYTCFDIKYELTPSKIRAVSVMEFCEESDGPLTSK